PKVLQNTWVRGGGGGRDAAPSANVTVTTPSGERVEGRLVRIDDFLVTVESADGSSHTFSRDVVPPPKVDLRDPLKAHRDLLAVYTDKDMHDLTAYLVTLK